MCSFMLICQCCFAIVKVSLKKVTYLLTYLITFVRRQYAVVFLLVCHLTLRQCVCAQTLTYYDISWPLRIQKK